MIIWSGLGFLAALIPLVVFVLCAVVMGKGSNPMLGTVIAALVSAAIVWFLGRKLNSAPGRELIDPKTQQRVILRTRHTLFWIPMEWWAIAIALVGIIAVAGMVSGSH